MKRIQGIDSIRFICAFIVVLFHFGLIKETVFGADPQGWLLWVKTGLTYVFNGPAAVIVFFVISGFCIHFPFRNRPLRNLPSYFSRRLIRVGLPALIALYVWTQSGVRVTSEDPGIFWSVICEVVYYLLYPILLPIGLRTGWPVLVAITQLAAFGFAATHSADIEHVTGGYPAFNWWNWVVGLPCWITGCWLAEIFQEFPEPGTFTIWSCRGLVFTISVAIQTARFQIGSLWAATPFTLNLFSLLVLGWLGLEIAYRRNQPAPAILEWAGQRSYSLYLTHPAVPGLLSLTIWIQPSMLGGAEKMVFIVSSLPIACAFYWLLEAPSHRLAVSLSKYFEGTKRGARRIQGVRGVQEIQGEGI
ncbi:MAG: acyltransferase [Verrucomicrobia bacterium]|nr:acyltransferase [Verrucomicrobiota bacterium]